MSELRILAHDLGFPEGPVAMADGSVILTEIRGGTVTRIAPGGAVDRFCPAGGGPNGLAVGPDGALYCCNNGGNAYAHGGFLSTGPSADYQGGSIQRIDLRTGEARTLYTHCGRYRLSAPNDIVFDAEGGFYFTDLGKRRARDRDHGGLYYALPDGLHIAEIAHPIVTANGVGLSPDGKVVYVADTEAARLWAFDIEAPGVIRRAPFPSPHGGRLLAGLDGYQRFDSLAVEANGNICVATLNTGAITVISPSGQVLRQVKVPDVFPTNICFGGNDRRTAYITLSAAGQLAAMPWPEAGLPLHYNA